MKISMMILFAGALLSFQLHAEDTRDQVRNEILKSFDEAGTARQIAIDELRETVQSIEDERAQRGDKNQSEETMETKIVKAQALGNIAQATAIVEIAKHNAKEKMVKAIIRVEGVKPEEATPLEIANENALAVEKIVKAITTVEIAKAKAAHTIMNETKKVEFSKTNNKNDLSADASAQKIANNISAVKIARSVSAVEITEAVSKVEITKALLDEDVELSVKDEYKDLTLDEIESKAKADISTIQARMEVARAKALSDIAQIVSFVKITEAIKSQNEKKESIKAKNKNSTYPKKFIKFNVE